MIDEISHNLTVFGDLERHLFDWSYARTRALAAMVYIWHTIPVSATEAFDDGGKLFLASYISTRLALPPMMTDETRNGSEKTLVIRDSKHLSPKVMADFFFQTQKLT